MGCFGLQKMSVSLRMAFPPIRIQAWSSCGAPGETQGSTVSSGRTVGKQRHLRPERSQFSPVSHKTDKGQTKLDKTDKGN